MLSLLIRPVLDLIGYFSVVFPSSHSVLGSTVVLAACGACFCRDRARAGSIVESFCAKWQMGYIGHHGVATLHKYKYSGVDHSLVAKYILQPFWSRSVTLFPLWMPAAILLLVLQITLTGFMFLIVSAYLGYVYSPHLDTAPPRWVHLAHGLLLFLYQTFDAVDGKQARRTNSSSPLGELFDHGCDALACAFEAMAFGSTALCGRNTFWFWVIAAIPFYLATWEHISNVHKVVKARRGSMILALAMLFPFGVLLAGVLIWSYLSPSDIMHSHPHLLIIGTGFAFGFLVGRMILAHLCDEPKGLKTGMCMSLLFLPLAIANALTARLNDGVPLIDEHLILILYCLFTVLLYLHFATSVIHEITNALGIYCFRLRAGNGVIRSRFGRRKRERKEEEMIQRLACYDDEVPSSPCFPPRKRGECPIKTRIGRNGKGTAAAETRSRSTCFGRKLGYLEAELRNGGRNLLGDRAGRGDAVTTPPKPGEYIGADIG
ncbi:CDP-alcohol phosphatidyltransferase [Musa troglodytarum]|uniref:CDP-alcohol phosphatidyltransferase n=1 Tax=Musa troglodytarum TaxID=320322 RepID=A0A9E7F3C9_9LILI|nr:CDP-alcohol phosphatidyltransferase [Musa troglodytarum]